MPQTSVTAPTEGQEGTFATAIGRDVTSRVAAESLVPGTLCVITTGADTVEQPDLTGDVTGIGAIGIVLLDETRETLTYSAGESVPIAIRGDVWVLTEDSADQGVAPFVRFTDASAAPFELGSFRSDDDTGDAVALPGAYWASTQATAGGLAIVRLSKP